MLAIQQALMGLSNEVIAKDVNGDLAKHFPELKWELVTKIKTILKSWKGIKVDEASQPFYAAVKGRLKDLKKRCTLDTAPEKLSTKIQRIQSYIQIHFGRSSTFYSQETENHKKFLALLADACNQASSFVPNFHDSLYQTLQNHQHRSLPANLSRVIESTVATFNSRGNAFTQLSSVLQTVRAFRRLNEVQAACTGEVPISRREFIRRHQALMAELRHAAVNLEGEERIQAVKQIRTRLADLRPLLIDEADIVLDARQEVNFPSSSHERPLPSMPIDDRLD